ncbi:restriction endonuclease subunit S [Cupriavidus necator]
MSMRRYPRYRDSGIQWLGEVPEHWRISPLKHLASLASGGTPSKDNLDFWDGHIPWASAKDLKSEKLSDTIDHITQNAVETGNATLNPPGSVLVVVRGMILARTFPVVEILQPMAINQDLKALTPREGMRAKFLAWLLRGSASESLLRLDEAGHGTKALRMEAWTSMQLPVPPLDEQSMIATFLERESGKIEALIAEQERLIALTRQEIVSLVLSAKDAPNTKTMRLAHAAILMERPVTQREGELYVPLGLFNRGRGVFHKEPRAMSEMGDSDFFWIAGGDLIISGQFAWEGAVALASNDEAGCVVSHRYHVLRGRDGVALTEYLFALLTTEYGDFILNESSWGAAGRNRPLNIKMLMKETIQVPDLAAQSKVAHAVHMRARLIQELAMQADLLRERRDALVTAAITGKIDVREVVQVQIAA